jgi:two-component system sensor histidine kinase KdpD
VSKSKNTRLVFTDRARAVASMRASLRSRQWHQFAGATSAVALATLISAALFGRTNLSNVTVGYVLCIVLVSLFYGYGPALFAAVLSALLLDLGFTEPYWRLTIANPRDAMTVAVMFVAGVIIASLTKRVREQAKMAELRERTTALLYALSRDLVDALGRDATLQVAVRHLHEAFETPVLLMLPDTNGALTNAASGPSSFELTSTDRQVADFAWLQERAAGWGTEICPGADSRFLPLRGSRGKVGLLGVKRGASQHVDPGRLQLLETFAAQVGSALERVQLAEIAQRAEVEIDTERLRSSLLSSVSHDLRTPLGVITGATETLLQHEEYLAPEARKDLLQSAHEEAERLNRLVGNLLDMTRLSSGTLQPNKEWHPLDEVVGVALDRVDPRLDGREVTVVLPSDLPPLPIDAVLMEQVLINLLENAIKYTPPRAPLEISARATASAVEVGVADRGPGIPTRERAQIFDKFYRIEPKRSDGGAGLGLAICRGIVESHGGRIWVDDREGGGAVFRFSVPLGDRPAMGDQASMLMAG